MQTGIKPRLKSFSLFLLVASCLSVSTIAKAGQTIAFNAQLSGSNIICAWESENEISTCTFTIERAVNNKVFSLLTTVPGIGIDPGQTKYFIRDTDINTGTYYYRLKQIDGSGATTYSAIRKVVLSMGSPGTPVTDGDTDFESNSTRAYSETEEVITASSIAFNAKPFNPHVKCVWMASQDISADNFTLQRSLDGNTFVDIRTVAGPVNPTTSQKFTVIDSNVTANIVFYRVRHEDTGDGVTYSATRKVIMNITTSDSPVTIEAVYPNSFQRSFTMDYSTPQYGTATVRVINILGKTMSEETIVADKGLNSYQYTDNANIPTGIYYLTLTMDGKTEVKRIIKD